MTSPQLAMPYGAVGRHRGLVTMPEAQTATGQTRSAAQRGFAVLRVLGQLEASRPSADGSYSLTEIAVAAGIPDATAHRKLNEAADEGLVLRTERGRYALMAWNGGRLAQLPPLPPVTDTVLTRVQRATGQMVILYAAELVGHPLRVRRGQALGTNRAVIETAPASVQSAIDMALLEQSEQDPVALAILAHLDNRPAALPPLLRGVRDCGMAIGPSPLTGWVTVALPIWRRETVTGALALIVPDTQMRYAYCRKRYVDVLTKAAAALSHHTTRAAGLAPVASAEPMHTAVCGRGGRFERASA
ncbi:helix-turn-helix domain-containing protein [Actinacidiphila glaucinigra]|uniref:helix-turn-helix domain-containing protein n=2 Tax=Actinacidiphila glaucinigra TaxID=235986 RepID=UPI003D89FEC8